MITRTPPLLTRISWQNYQEWVPRVKTQCPKIYSLSWRRSLLAARETGTAEWTALSQFWVTKWSSPINEWLASQTCLGWRKKTGRWEWLDRETTQYQACLGDRCWTISHPIQRRGSTLKLWSTKSYLSYLLEELILQLISVCGMLTTPKQQK